MNIFIALIMIIFFLYFFNSLSGSVFLLNINYLKDNVSKKMLNFHIVFITLLCLGLVAFRANSVGIDTPAYLNEFLLYQNRDISFSQVFGTTEWGYKWLQIVLARITKQTQSIFIVEAFIYLIPVAIFIKKYSVNPYLSFIYFIALDYFLFSMTGVRQTMAMGICLLAINKVESNKYISFFALTAVACLFHKTAIIFLPIIVLRNLSMKKKYYIFFIALAVLFNYFKEPIRVIISQFARIDYGNVETGGNSFYLFLVFYVLLDIILDKHKWNEKIVENNIPRYMLLTAVIMYPILQYNPTLFRLHYYYSIAVIIAIPNSNSKIDQPLIRLGFNILSFVVTFYYMVQYTFVNMGAVPYEFFWNI